MTDRRDAADREAREVVRLARRRASEVGFAGDRRQSGEIDPVRTRDQGEDRFEPCVADRHEHERLDDLPKLRTDGGRGLFRRVRRLIEDCHRQSHALAGGRVDDTDDAGMIEGDGHGAESSIGTDRQAHASIVAMDVLILADGDAPTRAELDAAWPGWADAIGRVVAADGGARHAPALGVTIDRWVGDGDSLEPGALAVLAANGVAIARSPTDKDESDTELAIRAALDDDPAGIVILGAMGGPRTDHALANVGLLALPSLVGRGVILLGARSRIRLVQAPGTAGATVTASLSGSAGSLVSLLPYGGDVAGVTTAGLVYPLLDEPLPVGTTRGLSNLVAARGASITVRSGRLLVVESPATLPP